MGPSSTRLVWPEPNFFKDPTGPKSLFFPILSPIFFLGGQDGSAHIASYGLPVVWWGEVEGGGLGEEEESIFYFLLKIYF